MHTEPESMANVVRGVIRRLETDPLWVWRHASAESERALRRWWDTAAEQKGDAYCAYIAARDRETAAIEELRSGGLR